MRFAAIGDLHGRLDQAADLLRQLASDGEAIEFALQVGDTQFCRNASDLASLYAPFRTKRLHDFPHYANGGRVFPVPMYFIGGNHEAYGFLEQGPEGMRVAANLHYLGRVGMTEIQGLKIAYLSGGFDPDTYEGGRQAISGEIRDDDLQKQHMLACFTKQEVMRLAEMPRPHVLVIHPWPYGLVRETDHESNGPVHRRLRYGETGIRSLRELIEKIGPRLVLCGHRHRRYWNVIGNRFGEKTLVQCLDEVQKKMASMALYGFDGTHIREVRP